MTLKHLLAATIVISVLSIISAQMARGQLAHLKNKLFYYQAANATAPKPKPAQTVKYRELLAKPPAARPALSTESLYLVGVDGSIGTFDRQFTNTGEFYMSHRHLELTGGIIVEAIDQIQTVTAMIAADPLAEDRSRGLRRANPAQNCLAAYDANIKPRGRLLRTEQLLGFETVVIEDDQRGAKFTKWLAPALGCTELRRLAEFKDGAGTITDTSDLVAIEATLGAIDETLLQIPSTYQMASPSERYRREANYFGRTIVQAEIDHLAKADSAYEKHRYSPR